jgi:AmiR/NasT family two-component response regulator
MLSSVEADRLEDEALEQGAAAYLEKGIEPHDLVRELRAALASHRCDATPSPAA